MQTSQVQTTSIVMFKGWRLLALAKGSTVPRLSIGWKSRSTVLRFGMSSTSLRAPRHRGPSRRGQLYRR
ncbi:hypothetical protein [Streptomyces xantholiticus]|uniref:Uncharacterized protein n=1 Tax=Streptomyces xantholiticus TaxID=68285 RepID=A0ABV1UPA8_9ACTN